MSFKNNLKYNIEQDLTDMLGLTDNKNSLDYDLRYVIENGIDKYNEMMIREQEKRNEIKNIMIELLNDKTLLYQLMKILEFEGFVKDCPTCAWNIEKYGKLK
ncbi:MAG TPA: hypothetical protein PLT65_01565 [Bacilli bacterium]|nr:hypothetical protein [Bacilli bacterium]